MYKNKGIYTTEGPLGGPHGILGIPEPTGKPPMAPYGLLVGPNGYLGSPLKFLRGPYKLLKGPLAALGDAMDLKNGSLVVPHGILGGPEPTGKPPMALIAY